VNTRHRVTLAIAVTAAVGLVGCASGEGGGSSASAVRLDYAYWNPLSLVVRDQQCLENRLDGTKVEWVLSSGSNKANENLNAEVIDVGSTAGVASFVARANGAAIKTIAVFSQPEWAAVVVPANSPITSIDELAGSKIAATKGTDPYFFLLRALNEAGLSQTDVEIINLQHADGQAALARGDVDAWAGLDPIMAAAEVNDGVRLIYRNIAFNSYGVLNVRERYLERSPDMVTKVLECYQEARAWIVANPDAAVELLAREASLDPAVARTVLLERTNIAVSLVPGDLQRGVLDAILPVLVAEGQVRSEAEARTALDSLYDARLATEVSS
jgi:sulfonate transport system substrate-binding protein